MQFDLPKEKSSIIKVIGVGGGGSNAVNHMFKQGIKDVDFIVCNTDRQVLDSSPVPLKIQLGATLTEGLGAGSLPEMGMKAALENIDEIRNALSKTKMLFITAGMGGGTGTGAAPVIAKLAREMGILTVSICTLPFSWEGKLRKRQAEEGLAELKKYSDAVLVILNDKIREIYHNLKVGEAFAHADNVLCSAAKCIAELINVALTINVDFNDVRRVMENSGVAIMGSAMATGEGRSLKAVTQALNSPLLNDNDIRGARYVLVSITCGSGKDELTMDELAEITDYVQEAAGQTAEMIKGYGTNDTLGEKVSVTIIASGFERKNTDEILPEVQLLNLHEAKPAEVKKADVTKITEPMLKSEVMEPKNTFKEDVKEEEEEAGEIFLKKKEEEKIEPLNIEVKLPPVKEESYGVEIFHTEEKEEPKAEILPEIVADEEEETKIEPAVEEELEIPFAEEAPAITEVPEDEIKIEEEETPPVFEIIKEEEKSIEFDLTAKDAPSLKGEDKDNNTLQGGGQKEEPKVEVPAVNMEVKRSNVAIEKTVLPVDSKADESKVTKIGEVQLNSQPPISDEEQKRRAQEKIQKLRELSFKVKTPGGLAELENEPAYKRKNIMLTDTPHSSESEISRLTLGTENNKDGTNKTPSLRPDNSFLHDKPD
ncbi:MAG: cell division protein FtsZ [Bacteroidetes bacterium]|nr:cell division protein FtsZ [Bacteroidota bacterium]